MKSWGEFKDKGNGFLEIIKDKLTFNVVPTSSSNVISVTAKQLGGNSNLLNFIDTVIKPNMKMNTFKRISDGVTLYFKKGVKELLTQEVEVKFFRGINKQPIPENNIITMDLETREINDKGDIKMEVVCLSLYTVEKDGNEILKTFLAWEYKSVEEMLIDSFNFILKSKYSGYSVYFHNFAGFDSIFIFKQLVTLRDIRIDPLYRDGKIIQVKISYDRKGDNYKSSITIFDSMLILPSSLEKLGKSFGSEHKGMFPLKVLNEPDFSINYKGEVPSLEYFYTPNKHKKQEYTKFVDKYSSYKKSFENKQWCLKDELINYCEQDVKTLYNVISKFATNIHNKFSVNIMKYPTIPSIAFAIWRLNFLRNNKLVPILNGPIYNDIKQSYFGGFVDVYKPYAEDVKSYDVNSLYPDSMLKNPMPMGKPLYFEGSNHSHIKNLFGFVYCKISISNLKTPILPVRFKIKGVTNTIYPNGNWSGWYFTEEIKNAEKYGYKIEILKGYHFEKANLFKDYVSKLYKIKKSVTPANPWYQISKLLLNSLYGRFGMNPILDGNKIIKTSELDEYVQSKTVVNSINFDENTWIMFKGEEDKPNTMVSVAIASAITAYSRIHMSNYIMQYSDYICAIDTDGIKITCYLDPSKVGSKLGEMKDEGTFKEAVFIAPKVYGGITTDDKMVVKVKGLKEPLSYWDLKTLLHDPEIKVNQFKWFRDMSESTIYIRNQIYTLQATENKRKIIRDSNGKFIDTKPYNIRGDTIC